MNFIQKLFFDSDFPAIVFLILIFTAQLVDFYTRVPALLLLPLSIIVCIIYRRQYLKKHPILAENLTRLESLDRENRGKRSMAKKNPEYKWEDL